LERTKRDLLENYSDIYDYAEDYFVHVANLPQVTPMDIIGHFDLLTKWQEREPLFDEMHSRYRAAAEEALKALAPLGIPFEINCGAMARGYRTAPYPAKPLLRSIFERGGEIIINGDCHNADHLGYGFDIALKMAKECGFNRVVTISSQGKQFIEI
jgi:histidinol-phosphatase (PHP family)